MSSIWKNDCKEGLLLEKGADESFEESIVRLKLLRSLFNRCNFAEKFLKLVRFRGIKLY